MKSTSAVAVMSQAASPLSNVGTVSARAKLLMHAKTTAPQPTGAARCRMFRNPPLPRGPCGATSLQCSVVGFAGPDAQRALDIGDENLAVANLAGLGSRADGLDDLVDQVVAYRDLDAGLGHEIDHVLSAAVELGMAALATEALHLGDGHARDPQVGKCRAHVVELERLDDRCDQFHQLGPRLRFGCLV